MTEWSICCYHLKIVLHSMHFEMQKNHSPIYDFSDSTILPSYFSENHSPIVRLFRICDFTFIYFRKSFFVSTFLPILRFYILKRESHSRILRFFQLYSFTLWFLENNYPILPMLRLNSFEVIVISSLSFVLKRFISLHTLKERGIYNLYMVSFADNRAHVVIWFICPKYFPNVINA